MAALTIGVAMSGGVDSSLAAALLKHAGHDIIGVTFKMWPKEECGTSIGRACCNLESVTRARAVASALDIPYYVFDLSEAFREEVVGYFCAEYQKGLTPNPCVVCNERIKFAALFEKVRALHVSHIATGHFVRVKHDEGTGRCLLREGRDPGKDQSYFLYRLTQEQLSRAIFPLGDHTKEEVRALAREYRLASSETPSSQDVCFIQDKHYARYIEERTGVRAQPGDIIDRSGSVLGRHKGVIYYTIGQRRGLGIAHTEPLYVTGIDVPANRVIVGAKKDLLRSSLIADRLIWSAIDRFSGPIRVMAKIRYNTRKAPATIADAGGGAVRVDFDAPQEAPTPGQAVVFYDKDVVLGGGWIRE